MTDIYLMIDIYITIDSINIKTRISAVAKRPRDVSCLSVVSFNNTNRRAQSFVVGYVGYRFITAYN